VLPGDAKADTANEPLFMETGFSSMITQVFAAPGLVKEDILP
jgi:hypothetical protein